MLPQDIPNGPWQEITVHYFSHKGRDYLLVCDLFSKYPSSIKSPQSQPFPTSKQELITQYRPPSIIYTDNGPPFTSEEFEKFLHCQYIEHITFSPYFPQSNVFIKCQVKTLNTTLRTNKEARTSMEDLLLDLWSTRISSREILHNRSIHHPGKLSIPIDMEAVWNHIILKSIYRNNILTSPTMQSHCPS